MYISEDFPEEIVRRRRILTPIYWAIYHHTEDGHTYPYRNKVNLTADHLIINGSVVTTDTLSKLPKQFLPEIVSTPSKQDITAFFTSASPLSNHYMTPVQVGKLLYNCVEQYYMHKKAVMFKDEETAEKILASKSPVEQKILGKNIKNFDTHIWDTKCEAVMVEGLKAKFEQSEYCRHFLSKTKPNWLVEANPTDRFWGVGL